MYLKYMNGRYVDNCINLPTLCYIVGDAKRFVRYSALLFGAPLAARVNAQVEAIYLRKRAPGTKLNVVHLNIYHYLNVLTV